MKKINIFKIVTIIAILCFNSIHVSAQNAITEATVEFKKGEGPTIPVNPEDPEIDSNEKPEDGSLVIVYVSDFDFDIIPVAATTQYCNIVTNMPNIQVVDLRGTQAGWRVSAKLSSFNKVGDINSPTLPGASIQIQKGRPNSLSTSPAPSQIEGVELTSDGEPVQVITADEGAGTGLWVMRWYPPITEQGAYINLKVPAGSATLGNHTAQINWILEDIPEE